MQPEFHVAGFLIAVFMFALAGMWATPVPPLVLIYVLVFTMAFDGMQSSSPGGHNLGRGIVDWGLALARHMISSWLCLFILFVTFVQSLYQSDVLAFGFFGATASAWAVSADRLRRWTHDRNMRVWTRSMRGALALSLITLLSGLVARPPRMLTHEPYRDLLGARYEVITDDLYAYGIQSPEKHLEYVTIIPGVGIGSGDVAFKRHIPRGSQIEVESAWHTFMPFDNGDYYLVKVSGVDLPSSLPTKIAMFRGNEGAGVDLNASVYRRLADAQ